MPSLTRSTQYPIGSARIGLDWTNGMYQRPHGITGWNTISFGIIWRVLSSSNITGSPLLQWGFKSAASTLPMGGTPGHWYFGQLFDATWTASGSTYIPAINTGMARFQNGTSATLATATTSSPRNYFTDDYANGYIFTISRTAPTSWGMTRSNPGPPCPTPTQMINAMETTLFANMALALPFGSNFASTTAYVIDEATFGALDNVFVYWSHPTVNIELLWTGVAQIN